MGNIKKANSETQRNGGFSGGKQDAMGNPECLHINRAGLAP